MTNTDFSKNSNSIIMRVENVFKTAKDASGELKILQNINFELTKGETVAIVGASGSGKSTLLSLLAGLDVPSGGKIILEDIDFSALNEDERAAFRAQKIGFVFQNFQLLQNLTALENVMLPLELTNQENAEKISREMLEHVGLGARANHYPKLLSGGEQQRVALARAFVMRPAILLADEPTGSLDFASGEKVMELMFNLNKEYGTTLIMVTHDLKIANLCHRRLTVSAGNIISDER